MKFNIFLMVIDSLQARKFYGEKTSLTPNIDSLMKKGTYFENFINSWITNTNFDDTSTTNGTKS